MRLPALTLTNRERWQGTVVNHSRDSAAIALPSLRQSGDFYGRFVCQAFRFRLHGQSFLGGHVVRR